MNCKDKSDEINCNLIALEDNYSKNVPPFKINPKDQSLTPAVVEVSTQLMNVLAISEFSHTINLKIGITLRWYENRVRYHNLKTEEALNVLSVFEVGNISFLRSYQYFYLAMIKVTQLWIPYIIFKNTDDDEAVKVDSDNSDIMTDISVTREGSFTRSGPDVVDEVI